MDVTEPRAPQLPRSWVIVKADEAAVRETLSWRYEPPYDFYNFNPLFIEEDTAYLMEPDVQAHAIYNEHGEHLGLVTFGEDGQVPGGDYRQPALDIGMAIRPDYTGRGLGGDFVFAVVAYAQLNYGPPALRVTVAEFNRRARRVWEKAGFRQTQSFVRPDDDVPFVVLVK
jgi:RimJ/RimL family protein N-acetyltransferase